MINRITTDDHRVRVDIEWSIPVSCEKASRKMLEKINQAINEWEKHNANVHRLATAGEGKRDEG